MQKCLSVFIDLTKRERTKRSLCFIHFVQQANAPVMHFHKLRIGSTESFKRICSNERFIRETKVTSETHLRAGNGESLWVRDLWFKTAYQSQTMQNKTEMYWIYITILTSMLFLCNRLGNRDTFTSLLFSKWNHKL